MKTITVTGRPPATLLVAAGDGPSLIMHADIDGGTVYIGDTDAIYPGQDLNDVVPINAQGFVVVNGEKDVYAIGANIADAHTINVVTGGMSFFQPVTSAGGSLVLASIHSPNFITGSSGWSINKDGSAEFNNLTIRNGTIVSGSYLLYSSSPPAAGTLLFSISATATTDSVGNAVLQGTTSYTTGGNPVAVNLFGGQLEFFTAVTQAGPYSSTGTILQGPALAGPDGTGVLFVQNETAMIRKGSLLVAENPNLQAVAESWHAASLQNSWANAGGSNVQAQYRLTPFNEVELIGRITHASVSGSSTFMTLPAGYRVAHSQSFAAVQVQSPSLPCEIFTDSTGGVQAAGLSSAIEISFHGDFSLDA